MRLISVLLLATILAAPVSGQDVPDPLELFDDEVISDAFDTNQLEELLDQQLLEADLPAGFGDDPQAIAAWVALRSGRFIRARELAEQILTEDRESFIGHCLLGMVLHRAEGSLPLAFFNLSRCRELFEARHGSEPGPELPWFWHAIAIASQAWVSGEMGRHEDKLRYLAEREDLYQPRWPADRGWPLMRLRRYDEARAAAEEGLTLTDQPDQVATAQTALCAIEAEMLNREASYEACLKAVELERARELWFDSNGPTPFTNAAESALGMLRLDEAERLILEGSEHFSPTSVSNPWLDLMLLYLAEGRTAEALDAMRSMFRWRHRQLPIVDEHNRAEAELASAIFLLVAGYPDEAARITARSLERPDRTGFTSAESEQMQAASAILDRLANLTAAELYAEEASWLPFWESLLARISARQRQLRAWSSGRRLAAMVADERSLVTTLRPYLAGSIETPEWVELELVAALGGGVIQAALEQARAHETLADADGYFAAYSAEVAYLAGRSAAALEQAEAALATLPGREELLRARVAVRGAQAALAAGRAQRALELFDQAWQLDPGAIRRLGAALPARFAAALGPISEHAIGYLRRSPRFVAAAEGFLVRTEGLEDAGAACLEGPFGEILACAQVSPRAGENVDDVARRLVKELHRQAFAPRVDLTQADLRSLDGSPTAGGGRSAERLRTVVDQVVDETGGR